MSFPVSGPGKVFSAHGVDRVGELNGIPLAGFFARAIAFSIDFLLAVALWIVLVLAVFAILYGSPKLNGHITVSTASSEHAEPPAHSFSQVKHVDYNLNFFHNWYSIAYLVSFFGLFTYFGNGRTVGKRIMGIRVVSLIQHKMTLWHSLERALGYGASALELGFGFAQFFIEPNRRTVHDRIAETIVVKENVVKGTG